MISLLTIAFSHFSNHVGDVNHGIYTNFALSEDGVWSRYKDDVVTEDVSPKEVLSADAYVLYYRQRGGYEYVVRAQPAMDCFQKTAAVASSVNDVCVVQ